MTPGLVRSVVVFLSFDAFLFRDFEAFVVFLFILGSQYCAFRFEKEYGDVGAGTIESHITASELSPFGPLG